MIYSGGAEGKGRREKGVRYGVCRNGMGSAVDMFLGWVVDSVSEVGKGRENRRSSLMMKELVVRGKEGGGGGFDAIRYVVMCYDML